MSKNLNDFEGKQSINIINRVFLDETVVEKDFSNIQFVNVNFLDCNFEIMSFGRYSEEVQFHNCRLKNLFFYKANVNKFSFQDCKLIGCSFKRAEITSFRFINCKLIDISFRSAELTDCEFSKSKLYRVDFSGSLVDNLIIKDSTFKKIEVNSIEAWKTVKENNLSKEKMVFIYEPSTFLEFFEIRPKAFDDNDQEALIFTMLFFILITILLFFITN